MITINHYDVDVINACFELFGALLLMLNCRRLLLDKNIKGTSVFPVIYFSIWGLFRAFVFYPFTGSTFSTTTALFVASVNCTWIVLAIYYTFFVKIPLKSNEEQMLDLLKKLHSQSSPTSEEYLELTKFLKVYDPSYIKM